MADLNLLHKNKEFSHLIAFIKKHGERRILRKKDFFIRAGVYHDEIAYILRGSFKFFIHDYRGKEQIMSFAFDHEVIACYLPSRVGSTALMDVQALEDSTILVISLEQLLQEILLVVDGKVYIHSFVESFAFDLLQKNLSFRRDSPEQRYLDLLQRVPDILNRISIKDIASYVGVTPETLSRIRSRRVHLIEK